MRCTQGAIYDVIVDLRPGSPAYRQRSAPCLPPAIATCSTCRKGLRHGFLTLEDDTEVFYQMSEFYAPDAARGIPVE